MKRIIGWFFVLGTLLTGLWSSGIRYNRTPSLPKGFYLLRRESIAKGEKGSIVYFCPPDVEPFREAMRRGYLLPGFCSGGYAPLIKPVVAVAGDRVEVHENGVLVNGRPVENSRPRASDSNGRTLEWAKGRKLVAGEVWVLSTYNESSFDSRYFGPIAMSRIEGEVAALLTW